MQISCVIEVEMQVILINAVVEGALCSSEKVQNRSLSYLLEY